MAIDEDAAYRALSSRDARFDGEFFAGVRTTGIYCRPSCPARTPQRRNVDFYPSSAAAQRAGFRACKRCRPDSAPGSADWNTRADLAGRAVRLIADGVVDRAGVGGLAARLGYSERQVTRALVTELGAPPVALARAQRAQTARILLERTAMPAADVAFAAGFASIRQFNETVRDVFAATPTQLRAAHRGRPAGPRRPTAELELRLRYRTPMTLARTLDFLSQRAIAGLEAFDAKGYTRVLPLPHGPALAELSDSNGYVRVVLRLSDHRDLTAAVARVRRLLDLDADPVAVDDVLARQPMLRPLVQRAPGLRSPGSVDPFEMAVRAIVGQQISVAGARTVLGRLTAEHGTPVELPDAGSAGSALPPGEIPQRWQAFPTPDAIAGIDPESLPMPRARGRTIVRVAAAIAGGELALDPGSDRAAARAQLLSLPGIGPWTADYLLIRVVGDPDIYLASDLGVKHALAELGRAAGHAPPGSDIGHRFDADATAPWRSYLTHHLWQSLGTVQQAPKARTDSSSLPIGPTDKDIR